MPNRSVLCLHSRIHLFFVFWQTVQPSTSNIYWFLLLWVFSRATVSRCCDACMKGLCLTSGHATLSFLINLYKSKPGQYDLAHFAKLFYVFVCNQASVTQLFVRELSGFVISSLLWWSWFLRYPHRDEAAPCILTVWTSSIALLSVFKGIVCKTLVNPETVLCLQHDQNSLYFCE